MLNPMAELSPEDRAARKLSMIVGDANGTPNQRCLERLARMIPKAGGSVPEDVRAFIEGHDIGDKLVELARELADSDLIRDQIDQAARERGEAAKAEEPKPLTHRKAKE